MSGSEFPRPPRPIKWRGPMSAVGSVAAQVLYVYGRMSTPDANEVDRQLAWRPGDLLDDFTAACYLMERGFYCQFFTTDTDEALVEGGLDAIRNLFGKEWIPSHAAYFTPGRVVKLQERAREAIRIKHRFAGLYSEPRRNATSSDVANHLGQRHVVSFMHTSRMGHFYQQKGLIVPDANPDQAWLYRVELEGGPSVPGRTPRDNLLRHIRYDAPIIAFWPIA